MPRQRDHNQQSSPTSECPVILHISDLHFGKEAAERRKNSKSHWCIRLLKNFIGNQSGSDGLEIEKEQRKRVLDSFTDTIKQDAEWKPKYICITGDIVHSGATSGYTEAREWLNTLLETLDLKAEDALIICPGNHDIDRKIADRHPRPENCAEADKGFLSQLPELKRKFSNYENFLHDMKIPQFFVSKGDGGRSYLYGVRETNDDLKFICWNSCWYSRGTDEKGNDDIGKLWLGMPLIQSMISEGLLTTSPNPRSRTIMLIHHSERSLDGSESESWVNRPATFRNLANISHIILSGHEHARVPPWDQKGQGAYLSPVGTVYDSLMYPNTFRLIKIDRPNKKYCYRAFEWISTTEQWNWQKIESLEKNHWRWFQESQNEVDEIIATHGSYTSLTEPIEKFVVQLGKQSDTSTVSVPRKTIIEDELKSPSSEVNTLDLYAQKIIDIVSQYERERYYEKALDWWDSGEDACKWFNDNKDKISENLVERIELIIEKIRLKAE